MREEQPARAEFNSMIITQLGPRGRRVRCTGCAHVLTERPADDLPKVIDPEVAPQQQGTGAGLQASRDGDSGATPQFDEGGQEPVQDRRGNPVGWAILVVTAAVIIIGGTSGRDAMIGAWPAAERLYLAIGWAAPLPGEGLTIKVTSHDRSIAGGRKFIVIKGEITNTSDEARDVPKLQALLRAADARALAAWDFTAARPRLLAGESSGFVTRYQNPPDDATAFEINFLR